MEDLIQRYKEVHREAKGFYPDDKLTSEGNYVVFSNTRDRSRIKKSVPQISQMIARLEKRTQ